VTLAIEGTSPHFIQDKARLSDSAAFDIKPYIPKFDSIPTASEGWTANKQWRQKPEGFE
jgi:hypothetical protein